jgi:hypothetical protein
MSFTTLSEVIADFSALILSQRPHETAQSKTPVAAASPVPAGSGGDLSLKLGGQYSAR